MVSTIKPPSPFPEMNGVKNRCLSSFLHVAFLWHSDIIFLAIIEQMLRGSPFDRQPALLGKNKKTYTVYKNLKGKYAGRLSKVSFFISMLL